MNELAPALGVMAALVGVADTIPYVRDIARGATRPHRGTWLIWGTLAVVVFWSQYSDGASWSLLMAGTQALLTALIFVMAIRHGEGCVTPGDMVMIAIAAAGVIGWMVADEPLVATVCVIAADLIGAALMLPKTWHDPESETLSTFALASVSGGLAVGAVGALDPSLLLYPAYFCLVNGAIAVVIQQRRAAAPALALVLPATRVREPSPSG